MTRTSGRPDNLRSKQFNAALKRAWVVLLLGFGGLLLSGCLVVTGAHEPPKTLDPSTLIAWMTHSPEAMALTLSAVVGVSGLIASVFQIFFSKAAGESHRALMGEIRRQGEKNFEATREEGAASAERDAKTQAMIERALAKLEELGGGAPTTAESTQATVEAVGRIIETGGEAARLIGEGRIDEAVSALRQRIAEEDDAQARKRAQEWRDIGALTYGVNVGKSIEAYEEAARLAPEDLLTYAALVRLYRTAGRLEDAVKASAFAMAAAANDYERSVALDELGNVRYDKGDLSGALGAFAEALEIDRRHLAEEPNSPHRQRVLSISLNKIGATRRNQGDLTGALAAFEEAMALRGKLAADDPSNVVGRRDLSVSLHHLGNVHRDQGNLTRALAIFEGALVLDRNLVAENPAHAEHVRDLSISLDRVGLVRRDQGNLTGALDSFEEALALRRQLAADDPSNIERWSDLSVGLNRVGDIHLSQRDLTAALTAFEESVALDRKLAADDPSHAERRRDLAVSLNKVGDVRSDQADMNGALSAFDESLALVRKLAADDPSHVERRRDISVSLERVGETRRSQGDLAGARAALEECLALRRELAADDPTHVWRVIDLGIAYTKLARTAEDSGDLPLTLKYFGEARDQFAAALTRAPDHADCKHMAAVTAANAARLSALLTPHTPPPPEPSPPA